MKIPRKAAIWCWSFVVLLALPVRHASGQLYSKLGIVAREQDLQASTYVSPGKFAVSEILRVIDDPHTGNRWLLLRDMSHPAAPGQLVRVPARFSKENSSVEENGPVPAQSPVIQEARLIPILRAGDRLIAIESSAVLDERLEAIALGPAVAGSPLQVRLKIRGTIVRAIAQAPGLVVLVPTADRIWR